MDLNCENVLQIFVYGMVIYLVLRIIQDNCDIGLGGLFRNIEGLSTNQPTNISASEGVNHDSGPQVVSGLGRTPSTCYPQPALKAEDLLPKEDSYDDALAYLVQAEEMHRPEQHTRIIVNEEPTEEWLAGYETWRKNQEKKK